MRRSNLDTFVVRIHRTDVDPHRLAVERVGVLVVVLERAVIGVVAVDPGVDDDDVAALARVELLLLDLLRPVRSRASSLWNSDSAFGWTCWTDDQPATVSIWLPVRMVYPIGSTENAW